MTGVWGTRPLRVGLVLGVTLLMAAAPLTPAFADTSDGVGVHRDRSFLLRESPSGGAADHAFIYGRAGDEALVGDWNGDGAVTVGIRRGSQFHLRNANSGGAADLSFYYGRADDEVVVGDFNGDGRDTIGVRRGSRFFLRNSNSGGPAHLEFHYGRSGDTPVVGDWNGDGVATVGVRRGSRYFLRNSNSGGPADLDFHYGRSGDTPIVGDFNGDGTDTMGVRRGSRFFLRNSNSGGVADLDFHYGRSGDVPLVGRWTAPATTTIGEFTTPLVAGQSRNVNIHLAADIIDGDVISPGSSYSLDEGIGPRTSSRGFVANGFIDSDGELISVVGGGVSQMGTTFLNAAWFAGIRIDEFRQHTIYFQRYPMCREATLQRNLLDVVVVNDTPFPIRIETSYTSTSVTVRLVGTPWASVSSWISSPFNVEGSGGAFSVSCSRTVTYPDGSTDTGNYSWRYSEGYPG